MRVVFFGTPPFALDSLQSLLTHGHDVAAVVTQPDRPQGRSRSQLIPSAVKTFALSRGLTVLQPERPMGDLFATSLQRYHADLGVVVAYGHILKPDILAIPRHGMINVHASLLPRYRGAAPVQWAIAEGDRTTGVSIMQMEAGLDSGPVLRRVETPIDPLETGGELTLRLGELGGRELAITLDLMASGEIQPEPQDHARATYAPKISRETARVDWTLDAELVSRYIRAFDPTPAAWTLHDGAPLKLFDALVVDRQGSPGEVLDTTGERMVIATGRGAVAIKGVQPAGRRRLIVDEWVRGRGIEVGQTLG